MQWYWWLLAAVIGLAIGWLAGMPYKKENTKISNLVVNLILGGVGGLLGALLYLLMYTLLSKPIFGVFIMSSVGAIILLWLLTRIKKAEADKTMDHSKNEKNKEVPSDEFEGEK